MKTLLQRRLALALGYAAGFLFPFVSPVRAGQHRATKGSFVVTTAGIGQLGFNTNGTDLTNVFNVGVDGSNILFIPGTANTTGGAGVEGNVKLWGPGDGSANGLPASTPDGENDVVDDGAHKVVSIQQQFTGLTTGTGHTLSFYWAGAQQIGYTGVNTESWQVSLTGDPTQDTAVANNTNEGFTKAGCSSPSPSSPKAPGRRSLSWAGALQRRRP
jgi:hypothetical protein